MAEEGKNHVSLLDLKPVKTRRIKPAYIVSKHKLRLSKKSSGKTIGLVVLAIIVIVGIAFSQSDSYKILRLGYYLKNKNILVGFQNSAELRPTGGFWGSFGILRTGRTLLSSELIFETNPYKNDNKLLISGNEPLPEPMKEVFGDRPQSFVNANWPPDFPETAKGLEWFLSQGWSQQADGTVAVSSLAVIDLLKLTGPLALDDGTEVSSDNFTEVMSKKIDTEYWQNPDNISINEPKTILKDLAPTVISNAKSLGYLKLYNFLLDQMRRGRVLAYFNQPKIEDTVKNLNISGEMQSGSEDYLAINNANLGGNKSSLNISQSINYDVNQGIPKPTALLTISRRMNSSWPNVQNRNYTRIYTPLGTSLISAQIDNQEIDLTTSQENAKTVFGFWFSVDPGQTKVLSLKYSLPLQNSSLKQYGLLYQKQPGTLPDLLNITVNRKLIFDSAIDESVKKFTI